MNKTTTTVLTVGVVAALVLGFVNFGKPVQVQVNPTPVEVNVPQQSAPVVNVAAPNVSVPTTVNVPKQDAPVQSQILGSVSGPDLYAPYWNVNGVFTYYNRVSMRSATTTLCAIKSPSATSTIESVSWIINTGTTTAATIDIGYGTTPYATSTALLSATSVASGAQGSASWSAVGNGTGDDIIAPNIYLIVKTAGAGLGGYTYGGKCQAEFKAL